MNSAKDPRPGAKQVTNTEEQDIAVNHSTVQERGFDEPVDQPVPAVVQEEPKPAPVPDKDQPATVPSASQKDVGKRIYDE